MDLAFFIGLAVAIIWGCQRALRKIYTENRTAKERAQFHAIVDLEEWRPEQ